MKAQQQTQEKEEPTADWPSVSRWGYTRDRVGGVVLITLGGPRTAVSDARCPLGGRITDCSVIAAGERMALLSPDALHLPGASSRDLAPAASVWLSREGQKERDHVGGRGRAFPILRLKDSFCSEPCQEKNRADVSEGRV